MSFSLVKDLFQICMNNEPNNDLGSDIKKRLTFSPDIEGYSSSFLFSNENGTLEIILFKSTLKKVFKESHDMLEQIIPFDNDLSDDSKMQELYYMTLGILLVANDHSTVINLHEKIVNKVLERIDQQSAPTSSYLLLNPNDFLRREISFISLLLNSNNNKLNKSSALWHLYKKLFTYNHIYNGYVPSLTFIKTALDSCELHPTNYYAWNFIKSIYFLSKLAHINVSEFITEQVLKFSKIHTSDSAAWNCLVDVHMYNEDVYDLVKSEFTKFGNGKIKLYENPEQDKLDGIFEESLISLISDSQTTSVVPHMAMRKYFRYATYSKKPDAPSADFFIMLIQSTEYWKAKAELGERGIKYEVKNGYFTINEKLGDDIAFYQDLQRFINWEEDIKWCVKFCGVYTNK